MQHLYEYYKGKNKQYAVNTQKETDDGLYAEFLQDSDFSTLEYTIPFQMLFVKASRERGIDLNIPKDPQFHHNNKMDEKDCLRVKHLCKARRQSFVLRKR